jgi:uncharacterized protein
LPSDLDPGAEAEIIALLARGWEGAPTRQLETRMIETHGARVFIGATETIKIKRPVSFRYMNFSSREKRQAACRREVEINHRFAPELYLGLVAITREADGRLALDGGGDVLELGVRMRAFAADAGLDQIVARGPLSAQLATGLGDMVAALHRNALAAEPGHGRPLPLIRERLLASAHARVDVLGQAEMTALEAATTGHLPAAIPILDARRAAGCVRRVHGDLHLGNIVLWQGRPVSFDAIEFDEDLGTLDPIYDLAFLLMDLVQRGQQAAATIVLNRYLWRLGETALADGTWDALRTLPLAMSLRALVRAVVAVDHGSAAYGDARSYLATALALASPPPPRLVAVGGYSGTGKSTLAAALAPGFGAAPGAIHLRSDVERKGLFGVEPESKLGPSGYTAEASEATYARVLEKGRRALVAGHSVIVDAVFDRAVDRQAIETVAQQCGVPFHGAWLQASRDVLAARVSARIGDASDATLAVLDRQLAKGSAAADWHTIDASGGADATLAAARLWLE